MKRVFLSPWIRRGNWGSERITEKGNGPSGSERRLPLSQCVCARVPVRVPVSPAAPQLGRPFLPPGGPAPPCPGLPVTACLFASPGGGGGGSDGGGGKRRREIVLIMPWFQQETAVRHARRLPPSPKGQETQGRMPRLSGRPRPGGRAGKKEPSRRGGGDLT